MTVNVDPVALAAVVLAKLRTIPDVGERVHDGYVPDELPEVRGYIRPYILLFSGVGDDLPEERSLTKLADPGVLDLSLQTQCVGPDANQARQVAYLVRSTLMNLRVGGGYLIPDNSFGVPDPLPDTQVTPVRFYLPVRWRLLTT